MPEFAAVIELSALDGTSGFHITGEGSGDRFGRWVSSAGDVNGDGLDDLIIGAPLADPNGNYSGASYVISGSTKGFPAHFNLSTLNGTNGFEIRGETASDLSGLSVSNAGDVNGDGIDDVIVGAPSADPHGAGSGASYVVFGTTAGFPANFDLSQLRGSNGFEIRGESTNDGSGRNVSNAGDVNGDGIDDLIIGAPNADSNAGFSGSSYVVFGRAGGFPANLELSALNGTTGFEIRGQFAYDHSGSSTSNAGDVNGDGFDDLIIGAPNADSGGNYSGASYVVFGRAGGFAATLDLSSLDGSNGFQIAGEGEFDRSGYSVSDAGDVNGDGFDDLIVGAPYAHPRGFASGASYVIFGKAGGFDASLELSALDGDTGFEIRGEDNFDYSGKAVSGAGDINGDGFDDLIIAARHAAPDGSHSSTSYVVFGKAGGFSPGLDLSALNGNNGFEIISRTDPDVRGNSVSSAGDINGDGFDDLIVGDPGEGSDNGDAYVIYGHRALAAVNRVGTALEQTINGGFGNDTIDGRGGNDVLIGWEGHDLMEGKGGKDKLLGGEGNDTLTGGEGRDALNGGLGDDDFDFNALKDSSVGDNRDKIINFTHLADDIDLSGIDAIPGGADDAFNFRGSKAFTAAGQARLEQVGEHTIIEINTVGTSIAEMTILLDEITASTITPADFIL